MKKSTLKNSLLLAASLGLLSACGGTGTVAVTTWGEEYVEDKIPAIGGKVEDGFVDGWTVTFSRFVISLGDIRLGGAEGEDDVSDSTFRAFDLAPRGEERKETGPAKVVDLEVTAARWKEFAYAVAPSSKLENGNADEADFKRLRDEGLSALVVGKATSADGERVIEFEWPFTAATDYQDCSHEDFGDGVSVASDERVEVQLTMHADHIFVDHLHNADADARFELIAEADQDSDGKVTLEELAAVELADLEFEDTNLYGTGAASGVNTLRDFIEIQFRSVGHFRGEGHCHLEFLD